MRGELKGSKPDRRDDILNAALDLFLNKGFHATSMSNIAKEAGVSTSHLYNFFTNKAEIAIAVEKQLIDSYHKTFTELPGDDLNDRQLTEDCFKIFFAPKRAKWIVTIFTEALRNEQVRKEIIENGKNQEKKVLKSLNLDENNKADLMGYEFMCSTILGFMMRNLFGTHFSQPKLIKAVSLAVPKLIEVGREVEEQILSERSAEEKSITRN